MRTLLAACVIGITTLIAGCSTAQRVRTETALARALISDEQASQLGAEIHADLQRQGVRFVSDGMVAGYVEGIADRILPHAKSERPGIAYRVYVIDDPEQVNAFATPGGYLYLYTGLLLTADNEAEVAGVLGHEAAHVTKLHIERQMVNAYGLSAIISMALGDDPQAVAEIAAQIAATGLMAAHGRSEEIEADEHGARYASAAGYDPRAMLTFFRKMDQLSSGGGAPAFLRTHPTSRERIANLASYIEDHDLAGGDLEPARHQQITTRIASN